MSNYFVIRLSDGAIIDCHIWKEFEPVLPPVYSASEHIYVRDPQNGAGINNGWTYVDGQFVPPLSQPAPILPPTPVATISDLQAQLHAIQTQLNVLLSSATSEPVVIPVEPVVEPTVEPVVEPTVEPTVEPVVEPTVEPTVEPVAEPTVEPVTDSSVIPQ